MELLELVVVNTSLVTIKFKPTIKLSSLTADKFTVTTGDTTLDSAFKAIDTDYDYNNISKTLTLIWRLPLEPSTAYQIHITGLLDGVGQPLDDGLFEFTTEASVDPTGDLPPEVPPVTIVDYSIKTTIFDEPISDFVTGSEFSFTDSDPIDGDYYLPQDYEDGRVTIEFSTNPSADKLTSDYFKVQKKKLQRTHSRWESVTVQITAGSSLVYVDFPSVDYFPSTGILPNSVVFHTDGYLYFEENTMYRIIVSKDLSS